MQALVSRVRPNAPDTEVEQPIKLGLADIAPGELPRLEMLARNSQLEIVAHIEAPLTALIVSPLNHILYLEAACTSDSGAHALMGSVSDGRANAEFRFYAPGEKEKYGEILPPQSPSIANARLKVDGSHKAINHVALLDRSGELLLSQGDEMLWRKIREKMSCPTLEHWGAAVMREVHESGMLMECESFGIPTGFTPYVLAPNAQELFDRIIGRHVKMAGIAKPETKPIIRMPSRINSTLFDLEAGLMAAGS